MKDEDESKSEEAMDDDWSQASAPLPAAVLAEMTRSGPGLAGQPPTPLSQRTRREPADRSSSVETAEELRRWKPMSRTEMAEVQAGLERAKENIRIIQDAEGSGLVERGKNILASLGAASTRGLAWGPAKAKKTGGDARPSPYGSPTDPSAAYQNRFEETQKPGCWSFKNGAPPKRLDDEEDDEAEDEDDEEAEEDDESHDAAHQENQDSYEEKLHSGTMEAAQWDPYGPEEPQAENFKSDPYLMDQTQTSDADLANPGHGLWESEDKYYKQVIDPRAFGEGPSAPVEYRRRLSALKIPWWSQPGPWVTRRVKHPDGWYRPSSTKEEREKVWPSWFRRDVLADNIIELDHSQRSMNFAKVDRLEGKVVS